MSTIFDSHCHPQFPQYDADREEMIARSVAEGVSMICIGTDLETSRKGIELAQQHENMWATAGIHPNNLDDLVLSHLASLECLLDQPKVVAVGEIGLDYYRTPEPEKQEQQKEVLKKFLELAIKHDKPVVLHARDASKGSTGKVHADMIEILNTKYLIHNTSLRGVAHSFTGSIEEAQKYLDLGFYLGFNGIITFPPSRKAMDGQVSGMYDELVKYVPLDRILLETDAPYLTPEPYRGQRNEPAYVNNILRRVAELKEESMDYVAEVTTANCKTLFRL